MIGLGVTGPGRLGWRPRELAVHLWGWTLRVDAYGVSLFDVWRHEMDADAAAHDCTRDHPDGACDEEPMGFRDDDLLGLFMAVHQGTDPYEALAEFHAGVRADPERPT